MLPLVGMERKRGMDCNFFIFMVGTLPGHCPNISAIEGGHFLVKHGTPSVTRQRFEAQLAIHHHLFRKVLHISWGSQVSCGAPSGSLVLRSVGEVKHLRV